MKAAPFIVACSRVLEDQAPGHEYSRWSKTYWFEAYKWALQQVALWKPEVFTRSVDMKLSEGSYQNLPSCCNKVVDTVENAIPVSRHAMRIVDQWRGCPPRNNRPYRVKEYTFDAGGDWSNLYVYPPVPADAAGKASFRLVCQYSPEPSSPDDDLPCNEAVDSIVQSLMLFWVCNGENESPSMRETAQAHYRAARDAIGLNVADDAENYREERQEAQDGDR